MTTAHKWTISGSVLLLVLVVVAGAGFLKEHDLRLKAEMVSSATQTQITSAEKSAKQDQEDRAQNDATLQKQLAKIAAQKTIVLTPQQAATEANTIPNLPKPVEVQSVPATASTPSSQNIVIPQADIPAFQSYKLSCDESNARLLDCSKNAESYQVELKSTQTEFSLMTKDRDNWKTVAKGGTFWHRTMTAAKWFGAGAAVGAVAYGVAKK